MTTVDAFQQLLEYASQDADPKVFEPMRKPINDRAAVFKQHLVDCQPQQLAALVAFAAKAFRRPLTDGEQADLRRFYSKLSFAVLKLPLGYEGSSERWITRLFVSASNRADFFQSDSYSLRLRPLAGCKRRSASALVTA